jgi:hypothetical protein
MGKKPLMTYNITSFETSTYVSLSFLNQFVDERNLEIAHKVIHGCLVASWNSNASLGCLLIFSTYPFNKLLCSTSICFFMVVVPLDLW